MRSKRLEKEELRQAEPVRSEEELDASKENVPEEGGRRLVAKAQGRDLTALDELDDDLLEDEEEEQAEDAMTGGA